MEQAIQTGVRFANNSQIDAAERAVSALDQTQTQTQSQEQVLTGIASHVHRCWQEAKNAKDSNVTARLLKAQLARTGKYDAATLADIRKFGGSEEYARITANKCRVADAWIRDIYIGQTEKPWTLNPTPKPDLAQDSLAAIRAQVSAEFAAAFAATGTAPTPEAMQSRVSELAAAETERTQEVARKTAERMEQTMYDQQIQGGFVVAMGEFIGDLTTYPAAHFKGPVLRKRPSVTWQQVGGQWAPQVTEVIAPEFERIDPFRIFPAPGATGPQDGFLIELVTLQRGDLYDLIGVAGFDEKAIREVLDAHSRGGLNDWTNTANFSARANINGEYYQPTGSANVTIDALEYHGPIQGRQLVEWGMSPAEVSDPDKDYEACVWLVGRWVIKAQLNYDPLGRRPYYKASYEELPGAYWGFGLVDILEDMQGIANAGVRSMVNNMAFSSGPQVGVNVDRLPAGEDLTNIHPLKLWQFNESETGSNTKAIEFFQPQSMSNELLSVIEKAYQFADDFSLIPRYMSGEVTGSIGRTASGMSMALNAANKGLKGVVSNIDVRILTPLLEAQYDYNMMYNPDTSIKGDAKVMARGAVSLMQLETIQLRRNEFLVATANPIDSQIVGPEGRAEILRETAKGLNMDVNRVVPPRGFSQSMGQPAEAEQNQPASKPGSQLSDGSAVTNNFGNNAMRGAV